VLTLVEILKKPIGRGGEIFGGRQIMRFCPCTPKELGKHFLALRVRKRLELVDQRLYRQGHDLRLPQNHSE
jgi:hypothetical protein